MRLTADTAGRWARPLPPPIDPSADSVAFQQLEVGGARQPMLWHGVPICFLVSNLRPRPAFKSSLCLHCDSKCDLNPCEHRARRGRDTVNMITTCDSLDAKTAGPARDCSGGLLCRIAEYAAAANERRRPALEVADPPDVRWAESNKRANEQSSATCCALVRYGVNETGNSVVCFVRFHPLVGFGGAKV